MKPSDSRNREDLRLTVWKQCSYLRQIPGWPSPSASRSAGGLQKSSTGSKEEERWGDSFSMPLSSCCQQTWVPRCCLQRGSEQPFALQLSPPFHLWTKVLYPNQSEVWESTDLLNHDCEGAQHLESTGKVHNTTPAQHQGHGYGHRLPIHTGQPHHHGHQHKGGIGNAGVRAESKKWGMSWEYSESPATWWWLS